MTNLLSLNLKLFSLGVVSEHIYVSKPRVVSLHVFSEALCWRDFLETTPAISKKLPQCFILKLYKKIFLRNSSEQHTEDT